MKHKAKQMINLKLNGNWIVIKKGEIIEHPFRTLEGFETVFDETDLNKDGINDSKDASIGSKAMHKAKKKKNKIKVK